MVVLGDRIHERSRHLVAGHESREILPAEGKGAFLVRPAVVHAASNDVDLFDVVLPDVGHVQLAGLGVERHLVRVAKTERPDLTAGTGRVDERIAGRDLVSRRLRTGHRIDPEDLAEKGREILRVAARLDVPRASIVGGAAITDRDVEEAVGTEPEIATVVVELWVGDPENLPSAGWVDRRVIGVGVVHTPLGDHVVVIGERTVALVCTQLGRALVGLRLVGVDQAVLPVVGVEREPEEASLVVVDEETTEVQPLGTQVREESPGAGAVVLATATFTVMVTFVTIVVADRDRPDLAVLLGDEEMVLVVRSEGRSYRRAESAGHGVEADSHVTPLDQGRDRISDSWSERDGWGGGAGPCAQSAAADTGKTRVTLHGGSSRRNRKARPRKTHSSP